MKNTIHVTYEQKPAYDIIIDKDYQSFPTALSALSMKNRRFMIISDSNVSKFHLKECLRLFMEEAKSVSSFTIPAGESSKNLTTVSACYEQLIQEEFDRNDVLVALGGGVVGDLTGFIAATYLRGIRFIQIPTSLLAMVDSSIGGKTGVDFNEYKNMVGAFHQPKLVYMNVSLLNTLKDKEFKSGMGEIIKHGLIKDSSYYKWLKENYDKILSKDSDTLIEMIERSCQIKRAVVEVDPKETGERALLNFGHTIGHAVEKLKNLTYLHGECVCIGMAAASHISYQRNMLSKKDYDDILITIKSFQQPIMVDQLSADDIVKATKHDKKMDLGQIRFILLKGIGSAYIDTTVTSEELKGAVLSVLI